MNPIYRKPILVFTSFIVLILLACNATFTVGYPTPTDEPPTQIPTSTAVPLSQRVILVSQPYIETNQDPAFTITAQIPQLSGSDDPRLQTINQRFNEIVEKEIVIFRQEFASRPVVDVSTNSFLEVTYSVISQYDDIWSIKFVYSFYTNGAAHPGDFSRTINYDLGAGRELALGSLFLPNSNYLEAISNFCIIELQKRNAVFEGGFQQGADPVPDNYRNWNISPDGLMITFDSYQVAPGAAGPQVILIPYAELSAIVDPQGPFAR